MIFRTNPQIGGVTILRNEIANTKISLKRVITFNLTEISVQECTRMFFPAFVLANQYDKKEFIFLRKKALVYFYSWNFHFLYQFRKGSKSICKNSPTVKNNIKVFNSLHFKNYFKNKKISFKHSVKKKNFFSKIQNL